MNTCTEVTQEKIILAGHTCGVMMYGYMYICMYMYVSVEDMAVRVVLRRNKRAQAEGAGEGHAGSTQLWRRGVRGCHQYTYVHI